jgi:hypothetical protein
MFPGRAVTRGRSMKQMIDEECRGVCVRNDTLLCNAISILVVFNLHPLPPYSALLYPKAGFKTRSFLSLLPHGSVPFSHSFQLRSQGKSCSTKHLSSSTFSIGCSTSTLRDCPALPKTARTPLLKPYRLWKQLWLPLFSRPVDFRTVYCCASTHKRRKR